MSRADPETTGLGQGSAIYSGSRQLYSGPDGLVTSPCGGHCGGENPREHKWLEKHIFNARIDRPYTGWSMRAPGSEQSVGSPQSSRGVEVMEHPMICAHEPHESHIAKLTIRISGK